MLSARRQFSSKDFILLLTKLPRSSNIEPFFRGKTCIANVAERLVLDPVVWEDAGKVLPVVAYVALDIVELIVRFTHPADALEPGFA